MYNYYHDIQQKKPLTKAIIWSQIKTDYNIIDDEVTAELQEPLRKLCELLIKNRECNAAFGKRYLEEMSYRKQIRDLFATDNIEVMIRKLGIPAGVQPSPTQAGEQNSNDSGKPEGNHKP